MTVKAFDIPFASSGDVAPVPDAPPGDGTVNYTQGFDVNYELAYSNSSALDVPREQFNQIMLDVTGAIQQLQQAGSPLWFSVLAPYAQYAIVLYTDGHVYQSAIAGNSDVPGATANWVKVDLSNNALLNAATFTVSPTAPTPAQSDSSTKLATTAFVNPAYSIGGSGYQKFSTGLILQWGSGDTAVASQTFPHPFPNACFQVTATITGSGASVINPVIVGDFATTGFNAYNQTGVTSFSYMAVGN